MANPAHTYAVAELWGPAHAPCRTFADKDKAAAYFDEVVSKYEAELAQGIWTNTALPIIVLYWRDDSGHWIRWDWATFDKID